MVFSSLLFLFRFLALFLLCYFIAPRRTRNLVLFLFSLIFYAWGEPVYIVLMLFSTVVDYTIGRGIHHFKTKGSIKAARRCMILSVVINLSLLSIFKYTDFIIGTCNRLFGMDMELLGLALPIGISFYTFQTMSYSIDVFRGDAKVQTNIISFGAYVAMFPQLIAGPIVRYQTVADEMNDRKENLDDFSYGVARFICGLGKKVLLANTVGAVFTEIAKLPGEGLSSATAWLGILAFTFQIYFDFSGYSDMAIGLGRMLGFHFLENFDHPYESKSITEFWRRWHISLGTWFREYVYIPLGGNRKGFPRQILNLAIVWFLTGLWHGASWNFVLWGLYFGSILILEKTFLLKLLKKAPAIICHIYTMALVIIGWAVFSWSDMHNATAYLKALIFHSSAGLWDRQFLYYLTSYGILLLIAAVGSTSLPLRLYRKYIDAEAVTSGQEEKAEAVTPGQEEKAAAAAPGQEKKAESVMPVSDDQAAAAAPSSDDQAAAAASVIENVSRSSKIIVIGATAEDAEALEEPAGARTDADGRAVVKGVFWLVFTVLIFGLSLAYLVAGSYNPFLYFRF